MNSRKDLIRIILYYSNQYTRQELEQIPDEELVFIKLKEETKNPALRTGYSHKRVETGKPGRPLNSPAYRKKKS